MSMLDTNTGSDIVRLSHLSPIQLADKDGPRKRLISIIDLDALSSRSGSMVRKKGGGRAMDWASEACFNEYVTEWWFCSYKYLLL